jgi:hypothetical protein
MSFPGSLNHRRIGAPSGAAGNRITPAPRFMAMAGFLSLLITASQPAAQESRHGTVNGFDVYYGILPAEMVLGHDSEHAGTRRARGAHHLVVALFNSANGERVTSAEVEARVELLGLAGVTKRLEVMDINQSVTFGNFFRMAGPGPYRITIRFRLPGAPAWSELAVNYLHPESN